jgi:outer membrane protein TolC
LLSFFSDRQELIEQVISSYYGVIEQRQLVDVQNASVELAQKAVEDAEIRLKEGIIAEIELTRAKFRLSSQQASAVNRLQGYQDSMDQLLLLLGMQVGGDPKLVTAAPYAPAALNLEELTKTALDLRPDLRLADLSLEDRQAVLRIAQSQSRPSLDAFAGWSRTENGTEETSWNAGLDVSIPIASRSLAERVKQARWSLLVSEQAREQLTQEVIADVRRQVRAAEAARQNVVIAEQGLETSIRSLEIARRMEEEGLGTNRDTLDAIDEKRQSETQLITNKIDYYRALIRLKLAVGENILAAAAAPEPSAAPAPAESSTPATPEAP